MGMEEEADRERNEIQKDNKETPMEVQDNKTLKRTRSEDDDDEKNIKKNLRTMRAMKYRKMIHQWKFKIIKLLKGIERNQKKRMKKSLIIIKYKKKEKVNK